MAITPPSKPRSAESFISAAPDASAAPAKEQKRTMKGNQVQISLALPRDQLESLDAFVAANPGVTRNSAIKIAINQMLQQGIVVNLRPVDDQS